MTRKGQEEILEGRGDEHIYILTVMMVTQICPFCQDFQDSMPQRINIAQLYFFFFLERKEKAAANKTHMQSMCVEFGGEVRSEG